MYFLRSLQATPNTDKLYIHTTNQGGILALRANINSNFLMIGDEKNAQHITNHRAISCLGLTDTKNRTHVDANVTNVIASGTGGEYEEITIIVVGSKNDDRHAHTRKNNDDHQVRESPPRFSLSDTS